MFFQSKILAIFLPIFLLADQVLEVPLVTKQNLTPVYLGKLNHELDEVLAFDLDHSGVSFVSTIEAPADADSSYWKRNGVYFVITPKIEQNALVLSVLNVTNQTTQTFTSDGLERQKIHRFLSSVQKELFGVEGVFHKRILYSKRMGEGSEWISEIWMCDFDGKNERQLTHEKGYCISPHFVPKRTENYVYVSYKHGQSKIFLGSFESKQCVNFIPLRGNQLLPSIALGCDKLAFIGDAAGRPDLFVQNFDGRGDLMGKPRQLYSFPRATQASPTFSPDGKQIAFVSDKDGPPRIYTLDLTQPYDKQQARLLTIKNRQNTSPCWSPDGTKLAYSAKSDQVRQIWIYDFTTKEEWQLTSIPKNLENPAWASDSIHLIFNSEDEDVSELYIANIYQGDVVKISEGPGQKRFPAWEN